MQQSGFVEPQSREGGGQAPWPPLSLTRFQMRLSDSQGRFRCGAAFLLECEGPAAAMGESAGDARSGTATGGVVAALRCRQAICGWRWRLRQGKALA